jgi:hypothetical protein
MVNPSQSAPSVTRKLIENERFFAFKRATQQPEFRNEHKSQIRRRADDGLNKKPFVFKHFLRVVCRVCTHDVRLFVSIRSHDKPRHLFLSISSAFV